MARALLIKLHLYCSAFFAAAIVLVAVSGGLYLIGIKGSIEQTPVGTLATGHQLLQNPSEANVRAALAALGVADFEFEYVKQKGSQLITRPTTRAFYTLDISGDKAVVHYNEPSLQKRMIELHMGHGPWADRLQELSEGVRSRNALYYFDGPLAGTIFRPAPLPYRSDLGRRSTPVSMARAFIAEQPYVSTHKKAGQCPAFSLVQRLRNPTGPLRPPCGRCLASQMRRQILAP